MTPEMLAQALLAVLAPIAEERRPGEPLPVSAADIVFERPRNREHGDWASNIAMRLAKQLGTNPRELAQQIADGLGGVEGVDRGQACAALALAAVIAVEQVLPGRDLAEIALGRRRRLRLPARVEVVGRTARLGAGRPQRLGDAGALAAGALPRLPAPAGPARLTAGPGEPRPLRPP